MVFFCPLCNHKTPEHLVRSSWFYWNSFDIWSDIKMLNWWLWNLKQLDLNDILKMHLQRQQLAGWIHGSLRWMALLHCVKNQGNDGKNKAEQWDGRKWFKEDWAMPLLAFHSASKCLTGQRPPTLTHRGGNKSEDSQDPDITQNFKKEWALPAALSRRLWLPLPGCHISARRWNVVWFVQSLFFQGHKLTFVRHLHHSLISSLPDLFVSTHCNTDT